jgi:hypothetical protein
MVLSIARFHGPLSVLPLKSPDSTNTIHPDHVLAAHLAIGEFLTP